MQRALKEFNRERHDVFRAITISPAIADGLINGTIEGFITSKKKRISGEVMLIAETGAGMGHLSALGKIKEVLPLEKMDFEQVQNLIGDRTELLNSINPTDPVFVVRFEKVERVIELPVFIQGKIWDLVMDKGDVFKYPSSDYFKLKSKQEQRSLKNYQKFGCFIMAAVLVFICLLISWVFA